MRLHSLTTLRFFVSLVLSVVSLSTVAADPPRRLTRDEVIAKMHPYTGASAKGVDISTLAGKVMCGYQGWFGAQGDGFGLGFRHWGKGRGFEPGSCNIDLWPDVSELDPDE